MAKGTTVSSTKDAHYELQHT